MFFKLGDNWDHFLFLSKKFPQCFLRGTVVDVLYNIFSPRLLGKKVEYPDTVEKSFKFRCESAVSIGVMASFSVETDH
jgi:hypothetical protein